MTEQRAPDRDRLSLERSITASWLTDSRQLPHIMAKVKGDYIADPFCRRVFDAGREMYRANIEPTVENLGASGKLAREDIPELYLMLTEADGLHVGMLTHRLCEMVAGERLKAGQDAAAQTPDIFKALTIAREAVTSAESVIQGAMRKSKLERSTLVLMRWSDERQGKIPKFQTGFRRVDAMLNGGLSAAGLSFVGGYAGEGKTSFALFIAVHLARKGIKVQVLEGEMPEDELHDRAARMFYGSGDEARRLWMNEYMELPLDFLLLSDRTPARLIGAVEYAAVNGVRFIVTDYMQAFAQMQRATDDHYLAIKNLSAELRSLVLRHAEKGNMLHVMALSNLNRTEAGRNRPGLSSLYGSSGLAHDCTEAIMIHSEGTEEDRMQEAMTGIRRVTVEIVKARNGKRGPLPFTFDGNLQRFEEEPIQGRRAG